MADWSSLRKKWTEARDKAGVKKGQVSGVSMGDAIDAVAKPKGYTSQSNALKSLLADTAKYRSKLQKTHPDLCKWIEKNIEAEAKDLANRVKLDIDSLRWIVMNMMAPSDLNIMTILPDSGLIQNVNRLMQDAKNPKTFAEAVKAVNMFHVVETYGPLMVKRVKTMKEIKWQAKLSGHDADYAELIAFADVVLDDIRDVLLWSTVTTMAEWGEMMKKLQTRDTSVNALPRAQKAMKHLLA